MIKMNRNNVGLFRWDGRSALRDTAPCNQPGNRQLRPDDGNCGIDGNMGRLVHGEILRHLRAVGARARFRRVRGIPTLFAGVSFIHGDLQTKDDRSLYLTVRGYYLFCIFFKEPRRDRNFRHESSNSVHFDKPRTGKCWPDSTNVSEFRARYRIESTTRAKGFCSLLANYFRTSATSRQAFTASRPR